MSDEFVVHDEFRDVIQELSRKFDTRINDLYERMMRMAETTQADIDAITTQVVQVAEDLASTQTTLQAEIDSLAQANPGLDVTALQAAIAPLDAHVQALAALKPTPAPVVPPVQDPEPVPVADPTVAAPSTSPEETGSTWISSGEPSPSDITTPPDQQVEVSEQNPEAPVVDPSQDPSSASSPSTESAPAPGQSSGDASATSSDVSSAGTTPTADPSAPAAQ